jgi:hypothetical protein
MTDDPIVPPHLSHLMQVPFRTSTIQVVPHDERARMPELGIGEVETIVMAVK